MSLLSCTQHLYQPLTSLQWRHTLDPGYPELLHSLHQGREKPNPIYYTRHCSKGFPVKQSTPPEGSFQPHQLEQLVQAKQPIPHEMISFSIDQVGSHTFTQKSLQQPDSQPTCPGSQLRGFIQAGRKVNHIPQGQQTRQPTPKPFSQGNVT